MTIRQPINVSRLIDESPLRSVQLRILVFCGLIAILDGFDTQAIAFVVPVMAREWTLPVSEFGTVFGAGLFGLMLGALVFGPLADRWGRKRILVFATAWFGAFALVTGMATSLEQLLIYRFLTGIGLGAALPNIIALTSEYAPARRRTSLVTLMFCGFPLGAVLGGAASTKLIGEFGWQSVFYLGGLLPLLLVPVLIVWLPESIRYMVHSGGNERTVARICTRLVPHRQLDATDRFVVDDAKLLGLPVKHLFRDERGAGTLAMWLVFFCNLLLIYFLINWLPSVLVEAGISLDRAIIGIVALNAGGIVGGLTQGWIIDRRGAYGVLGVSYVCGAIMIAMIGFASESVPALMIVIGLAGFCVLGTQFGMNALAADYYPTSIRSTGVGWALGVGRIGSIVGPVLGGVVIAMDWTTREIFLVTAIPAVIAGGGVLAIKLLAERRRLRDEMEEAGRPVEAPHSAA